MKYQCLTLFILLCSSFAFSQQSDLEVADTVSLSMVDFFIEENYTPTFDCPQQELLAVINKYLSLEGLSKKQTFQLTSMRTHSLICDGRIVEAQNELQVLLAQEEANRSAKYYLSAIFQYGFVFDMQENPERCNYYMLARDSAVNKFSDIHLSASLGYITECIKGQFDQQLASIYETMQVVTKMQDKAALAHAYNRVGSFYSSRNQLLLASQQYLKAYEAGSDIYTDGNRLSILGSALTSMLSSYQIEKSAKYLQEYKSLNETVGTRRSNFVYYLQSARLATLTNNYEMLEQTISGWNALGENKQSAVDYGFHRWYRAELCLMQNDLECLSNYLEEEKSASSTWKTYAGKSRDYFSFMVRLNLRLNNIEVAKDYFARFEKLAISLNIKLQENSNSMNIASLHYKIENLQSELESQSSLKTNLLIGAVIFTLLVTGVLLWLLRKRYVELKSIDSVTGLLNNTAVINKLLQLPAPGVKRTNALAIFDIANFSEVNLSIGSDKSDFVLRQIANTFKNITRNSDVLGRFGPEQFILCLADIEEDAAQAFFERTKEALSNSFAGMNNQRSVSVDSSMSIYYSTDAFSDINEILKNMLLSLSMKANKA